jgi:phage major head subunit gpT-like protein
MPVARGQWAELLAPGLNMKTFTAYRQHPELYRRFMNVKNSKKAFEDDFRIAGLGPLAKKTELGTTILDEPLKIGGQRYTNLTYALGIAISKEMRDDAQYPEILALAEMLGQSSYWTTELYGHDVFNTGFGTTKYTGRDGKALFATDHPIQGTGATVSNKVSTDLSEAGLEAAILAFDLQVNERGMPILLQPKTLLIHPSNRMLAKRLLKSEGLPGVSFTSQPNDVNPLKDEGLQAVSDPWITDADSWAMFAESSQVDLNFFWREMPDTMTWDDNNANATFHSIRQRHSVGFGDWRGTYGSEGAG